MPSTRRNVTTSRTRRKAGAVDPLPALIASLEAKGRTIETLPDGISADDPRHLRAERAYLRAYDRVHGTTPINMDGLAALAEYWRRQAAEIGRDGHHDRMTRFLMALPEMLGRVARGAK